MKHIKERIQHLESVIFAINEFAFDRGEDYTPEVLELEIIIEEYKSLGKSFLSNIPIEKKLKNCHTCKYKEELFDSKYCNNCGINGDNFIKNIKIIKSYSYFKRDKISVGGWWAWMLWFFIIIHTYMGLVDIVNHYLNH